MEFSGDRYPIFPFPGIPLPTREVEGRIEAMACYAGQSAGSVRQVQPAGEIVAELAGDAETLLTMMAARIVRQLSVGRRPDPHAGSGVPACSPTT